VRTDVYRHELPWWLRMFGLWGIQDKGRSWRFSWGEISLRCGFALGYSVYHDEAHWRIHLLWPAFYIKAPMLIRQRADTEDWNASYGFSFFERGIHLNWRTACKIVHLPWDWQHVRHEVFLPGGERVKPAKDEYRPPFTDGRAVERHPYTYTLRSGEVQHRTATIYGEEREWRWLWFTWLPWPRRISRSISIDFDGEVGERTGSWKGGVFGTGHEWRKGETMLDALRRFQRDVKL
jgi:hypothetical protein